MPFKLDHCKTLYSDTHLTLVLVKVEKFLDSRTVVFNLFFEMEATVLIAHGISCDHSYIGSVA